MLYYLFVTCFFFFKQKTAYELRISDWSSDVCSSDLGQCPQCRNQRLLRRHSRDGRNAGGSYRLPACTRDASGAPGKRSDQRAGAGEGHRVGRYAVRRSEEHTSELQSLMRISYAVFCLKKKKQSTIHATQS